MKAQYSLYQKELLPGERLFAMQCPKCGKWLYYLERFVGAEGVLCESLYCDYEFFQLM